MSRTEQADLLTQSLADPTRRAIVEALRFKPHTVSALVEATGRKQPNLSNHLAKMRNQGLVHFTKRGREVTYALASPYADLLFRVDEFVGQSEARQGETAGNSEKPETNWKALQRDYLKATTAGAEEAALEIVNRLLSNRVSMAAIYEEVLQPTLNHIGDLYLRGETDEAQEHLATATTERMMARVSQFYAPVIKKKLSALFACVEGNLHSIGLRMLSDSLKATGWETYFLGASVPTSSLLKMAQTLQPDLIVFSCTMEDQWNEAGVLLKELISLRKEQKAKWHLVAGGNYLQHHPEQLALYPEVETANDLNSFLALATRIESELER